ncbi:MAG: carbohydrate ABC transporter permease [Treponema sp.]|jgi:putative aldouronate transport system permease protein|nr:carbohydrate ABC transporter permease [Treponema sp.]
MKNESAASRIFDACNYTFLFLLSLTFLYPVFFVISTSLSSAQAIVTGKVFFLPVDFTLSAYEYTFKDASIIRSVLFTVELTALGTLTSLIITALAAYPLSRRQLKGAGIIMRLIVFTMYFSGGMIPTYLVVRDLHLFNSVWSLILPGAVSTFLLIIMITFFRSLPVELEEAAKLDGCSNFGIFFRVFLPISTAIIATVTVFLSVGYWNTFFDGLLYIQDLNKMTLQVKLYYVLNAFQDPLNKTANAASRVMGGNAKIIPENVKGATIVIAVLPVMIVYPFMQKHFVKGATIGAIKG